jgi:hypothetical protein
MSTFDEHVVFDGQHLYFTGPEAMAKYGDRPVPVTLGNNWHLGNFDPDPGSDLIPDLMNGERFYFGTRYDISQLDLAILADTNIPVSFTPVPEPGGVLVAVAAVFAAARGRRQSRDSRHHASSRNPTPKPASAAHAVQTMPTCGSGLASSCE